MKNLIKDIQQSARVFQSMRNQRRSGIEPELRLCVKIPIIGTTGSIYDTIEGCVLANCGKEIDAAAEKAFEDFSEEQKDWFIRSMPDGEFIERAEAWKEALALYLPGTLVHRAIGAILRQYIKIKSADY